MSVGEVLVNVYGKNVGDPIEGANVSILNSKNQNIIDNFITNSSGRTDIANLDSPPEDYSLEPNSPKPYGEYDIVVEKENFETITIKNVQIFSNTLSLQNIYLNRESPFTFVIPGHNLYETYPPKIAEDSVKPTKNPEGFVVLSKPVVPEYIIVHDGAPDDSSAPNYWVPYKNYIKNVCSSEIYPTWPYEAIVANVFAIISFTLNRVYTEWYKNKGYNFTITSSTAYDQSFVYQRNIYSQISNVVDNIFAQYITKPGIEQPLFTQYCDGQQTSCPTWLSQWGSKQLAENGANYVDILKKYYGYDIYFEIASSVAGIPSSYPGNILQQGSRGEAVRTIQKQLSTIRRKFPLIPPLSVDGIYGPNTTKSVEIFQETFSMPQTGIVDYATWYEISRVYVSVANLA